MLTKFDHGAARQQSVSIRIIRSTGDHYLVSNRLSRDWFKLFTGVNLKSLCSLLCAVRGFLRCPTCGLAPSVQHSPGMQGHKSKGRAHWYVGNSRRSIKPPPNFWGVEFCGAREPKCILPGLGVRQRNVGPSALRLSSRGSPTRAFCRAVSSSSFERSKSISACGRLRPACAERTAFSRERHALGYAPSKPNALASRNPVTPEGRRQPLSIFTLHLEDRTDPDLPRPHPEISCPRPCSFAESHFRHGKL